MLIGISGVLNSLQTESVQDYQSQCLLRSLLRFSRQAEGGLYKSKQQEETHPILTDISGGSAKAFRSNTRGRREI